MVAYSFKKRFIAPIRAGTKRQTIRADRKTRHAAQGETVQLYYGMRTRQCALIAKPICASVAPISIDVVRNRVILPRCDMGTSTDLNRFAVSDGFADWDDMVAFWRAEHPETTLFTGTVIRWRPITPEQMGPETHA